MYLSTGKRFVPLLARSRGIRSFTSAKTFSNQDKLRRLPVPDLDATLVRYKRSLLPILSQADFDTASKAIDAFRGTLGPVLQQRLYALDEKEAKRGVSWLDELWLNKAYLEYREPTLINVNWWNQFQDPPQGLSKEAITGHASDIQIHRAAVLISEAVAYSNRVNSEAIEPDVSRSGPFCMHQLKHLFGASRIADSPGDRIVTTWPATAQHVTIAYKDQFFSMSVFDHHGQALSVKDLESQLWKVVDKVEKTPLDRRQPAVGLITTEHRDTWAKVRQGLESNATNANSLKELDTSLFCVCLDDYSAPSDLDRAHRNVFHGVNGHNRWFDKALQFIVETNGRAGVNGEHSPADAVIPINLFNTMLENEVTSSKASSTVADVAEPTYLTWDISAATGDAIRQAEVNAKLLIDNLDSVLLHYHGYGANLLKKAKISPDALMQMVYQLAHYRYYGKPCPTYESASTRKFLTGRTETVRSCSVESVAFTKAWENPDLPVKEKLAVLDKAIAAHIEYMKAASNGHGVDRHLLGLRCQMTPEEATSADAEIFRHPSYWGSQYWRLSTSNTSPGDLSYGGFGPVVPEGYGINYAISKERVRMSISSWKSASETDSVAFRETIHDVMDELGEIAERYYISD